MRKHLLLILTALLFSVTPAMAGKPFRPFSPEQLARLIAAKGLHPVSKANITRLHQCAEETFKQALQAQKRLPGNRRTLLGNPVFAIQDTSLPPRDFLPPLPKEINSQQEITDYYLLRLNQQYIREVDFMENTVLPRLKERLPYLQQRALQFKQPEDPIAYIAQHIPAQVNTLVVSYFHTENFTPVLNYFWQQLRKQRPDQEIIILAEPLRRGYEWMILPPSLAEDGLYYPQRPIPRHLQETFGKTWDEAVRQQMRVIGLETPAVLDYDIELRTLTPEGNEGRTSFWASLEGVEIRNNAWRRMGEEILKKRPGVLIIYCFGDRHGLYNMRTSLTQGMDPYKTFVVDIYPTRYQRPYYTEDNSVTYFEEYTKDPMETLTNTTTYFPQRLVYFPDKKDALAFGCDARLRLNIPKDSHYFLPTSHLLPDSY